MKISINCPSYKRPKVETLEYLPFCKVWVVEEELEEYHRQNKGAKFEVLQRQGNISIVRNEILKREFERGADVVCMVDDDLKGIYHFEKSAHNNYGYEKRLVQPEQFEEFLYNGTVMARDLGAYLWGVNLNKDNMLYRHTRPIGTTGIILGVFSCHLRGTECFYDERIPLKEDYDMALQHLNKYRKILRLNKYHYDCRQSEQPGGCATIRNYKTEKEQFEMLQKKWGSDIVRTDRNSKKQFDYNPIVRVPISGL
jgi:hypothetical protein